jgi:ribosomal protein S24E
MKYFIDVTIIDLKTNNVAQRMNYDVNFANDATVTLESVKSELSQWVTIPHDNILVNEKAEIRGRKREDSETVNNKTKVYYTAYLQRKVKDQK